MFKLLDRVLHSAPANGMWECVDFFPVSMVEDNGLENNIVGNGVKHFLNESSDDTRTILFDKKTGSNVLQRPVEEIESLRTNSTKFNNIELDITAEFEIDTEALSAITEADAAYSCSTSGGAAQRGAAGPFGLLVLADESRYEQTPVYFYVTKGSDGKLKAHFCNDKSRSSSAGDVYKGIEGGVVPVLEGEKFSVRVLKSFAQGGRTCVTSRVYPTRAIFESTRVFVFNNATAAKVDASVKIWQMKSAEFTSYNFVGS
ncbi:Glycosyl hydrolase family 32, C-terminal [Dillenia turbinata]|uniref:Glycosyl hydrolase family 32, C-terminal n=1 Tax=Dillenia turbinata TaxID=194707 RepID=A0AAN8ZWF7_9MAGN